MTEFPPGSTVWAKVPGFPFWPSKVEDEADLPSHVLDSKPSPNSTSIPVYFFGSKEFGWIIPSNIKDFESNKDLIKKNKSKAFLKAVEEIQDPSCWPEKGAFNQYVDPSAGAVESEDGEESSNEQESKKRRKSTGSAGAKNSEEQQKKKRKRNTEDPSVLKKKVEKEKKPVKPELTPLERLMRLRLKLQLFLQQKDPYTAAEYEKANAYLSETEKLEMDVNMFRETKIGKVIKHLSKKGIAEFDISARCKALTEKWIHELQDSITVNTTTEKEEAEIVSAAPETPKSPKRDIVTPIIKVIPASPVKKPNTTAASPKKETSSKPESDSGKSSPKKENDSGSPKRETPVVESPTKANGTTAPKKESPKSPFK